MFAANETVLSEKRIGNLGYETKVLQFFFHQSSKYFQVRLDLTISSEFQVEHIERFSFKSFHQRITHSISTNTLVSIQ